MTDPAAQIARATERIDGLFYRLTKAALLRTQLLCARHGGLDADWRTAVLEAAAEPVPDIDDRHQQLRIQAAEEIANLPNADWEPDMRVGWRDSLEAWYAATKQCLDDIDDAQRLLHREAGLSTEAAEANSAMDRDLVTASYRAGLTAAGLVSDWYDWLHGRVLGWPHGPRRETQLAAMAQEDYRRTLQQLPRYWA
jgi:hypothetical protein